MRKLIFVLGLVMLVGACGRRDVQVVTPDGKVTVSTSPGGQNIVVKTEKGDVITANTQGGNVVIKSKDGTQTIQSGDLVKLPDDFPKDAPIYPGAKPIQSIAVPKGHSVVFTTPDPVEKVWAFYTDKLTKDGWVQQVQLQTTGDGGTMSSKKDNRTCVAVVSKADDTVNIQLSVVAQ